jgi:hypothetical protein
MVCSLLFIRFFLLLVLYVRRKTDVTLLNSLLSVYVFYPFDFRFIDDTIPRE